MTNEEAIEALKVHMSTCHNNQEWEATYLAIEALKKSSETQKALEKQIPKKPTDRASGYAKCPICGEKVFESFCRWCGQALLWEEEDERLQTRD